MTTATEKIQALIIRDIETGPHGYAEHYGYDWFNLTPEEEAIFQLELSDLPSLVAVWCAYEAALGICDMMDIPEPVRAAFFEEQPFIAESAAISRIDSLEFAKFAKLFGVPLRKSYAWYAKHEFWTVRAGITYYDDEREERQRG